MIASWYVPAGRPRPVHVPAISPQQLIAGKGPDDVGGGMVWGGPYAPDGTWASCAGGAWWVDVASVSPETTLRAHCPPGFRLSNGWSIPQVLRWDQTSAVGFWGPQGWTVPDDWTHLVDACRAVAHYSGPVISEHAHLVADLLGRCHHVTIHELGLARVLTNETIIEACRAACGITDAVLRAVDEIASSEHA